MRCPRAIELASVAREEITRTGEREHRAGCVFDHDDGSMRHVAAFEGLQSLRDDRFDLLLQRGIERGADRGGIGFAAQHFNGMRRLKSAAESLQHDGLVQRDAMLFGIEPAERVHLIEDAPLARQHGLQIAKRVQSTR